MHWRDIPIHMIDFEGSRRSGILEYGLVTLRGGRLLETATRLCRPMGQVDEADIAIHRIRPSLANSYPPFADEWPLFAGLREGGPLGGHFASAENHLIKTVWPYPRSSPDFARAGACLNEWGPWIDTGRLYSNLFPGLESANLQALVEGFGYQSELDRWAAEHCPADRCFYHAALYDALASALLLVKLLEQPALADASLVWLLQMSCGKGPGRDRITQQDLFER